MLKNYLFRGYIASWVLFAIFYTIVPARSLYSTHYHSVALCLTYLIVSIMAVFIPLLLAASLKKYPSKTQPVERFNQLYKLLRPEPVIIIAGLLSLCGLFLHIYDKVFIMGIDYSKGIATARHAWLASGAARGGGISSWQSATGHILVNFYFIPAFMLVLFWEELTRKYIFYSLLFVLIPLFVYSATLGTRSVPLVVAVFTVSLLLLRKTLGKRFLPAKIKYIGTLVFVLLFLGYALVVFQKRAEVYGRGSPKFYTQSFFTFLGGQKTAGYEVGDNLPPTLSALFYHGILATVYVTHSQWTFDYVLTLEKRPGKSLLAPLYGRLSKFNVIDSSKMEQKAFKGVFLSLPGTVWYDCGLFGLLLLAALHGAFIHVANRLVSKRVVKFRYIVFFILVGTFSIISPLTSLANLMSFPFMVFALLCLPILSYIAAHWPALQSRSTHSHLFNKEY